MFGCLPLKKITVPIFRQNLFFFSECVTKLKYSRTFWVQEWRKSKNENVLYSYSEPLLICFVCKAISLFVYGRSARLLSGAEMIPLLGMHARNKRMESSSYGQQKALRPWEMIHLFSSLSVIREVVQRCKEKSTHRDKEAPTPLSFHITRDALWIRCVWERNTKMCSLACSSCSCS